MNFKDILNESKKSLNYEIIKKRNKFFIINKDKEPVGNIKGWKNLKDAIFIMLNLTSSAYKKADFYKKQKIVNKEIDKWKTRLGIVDKKPRKKYGFTELN